MNVGRWLGKERKRRHRRGHWREPVGGHCNDGMGMMERGYRVVWVMER